MYIFGRNAVLEAVNSGKAEKVYINFSAKGEGITDLRKATKRKKIPCVTYDKRKFDQLERQLPKSSVSQGVIALQSDINYMEDFEFVSEAFTSTPKPIMVILDNITDVQNLGAIARSVECSGAFGIIIPTKNAAPVTPAAIKASAGALNHINICRSGNITKTIELLQANGIKIIGTKMSAENLYSDDMYSEPMAIVIGNEEKGISPHIERMCDKFIKIPMPGRLDSLNASVSAGIILFEVNRQRR